MSLVLGHYWNGIPAPFQYYSSSALKSNSFYYIFYELEWYPSIISVLFQYYMLLSWYYSSTELLECYSSIIPVSLKYYPSIQYLDGTKMVQE